MTMSPRATVEHLGRMSYGVRKVEIQSHVISKALPGRPGILKVTGICKG